MGKDWQSSFVIPAYLQEQYPDLDSVEDLKEDKYKALFATAETGGKARLVSCVIGWACEDVNAAQIEAYGLADLVHIINPGDGAAANADLYGAYEKGEPWLGYQWGTSDPALTLDLVRLEEPPYTDECWFTTKACGYKDATILIAVHPDLPVRAPEIVAMLRKWDFNIDVFKEVASWQSDNPDAHRERRRALVADRQSRPLDRLGHRRSRHCDLGRPQRQRDPRRLAGGVASPPPRERRCSTVFSAGSIVIPASAGMTIGLALEWWECRCRARRARAR